MNAAKAIEIALATVLRKYGNIGASTVIRTWQNLKWDTRWKVDAKTKEDRDLPLIDVRCTPHRPDGNQRTLSAICSADLMTANADDRDHAEASKMFEGVSECLERMRQAALDGNTTEARLALFIATLCANASNVNFGGLSYGDAQEPYDDAGVNVVPVSLVVHYSLTAYA